MLFQSEIDKEIGFDVSAGLIWRPWLNDNAIIQAGISIFIPGKGFEDLLTSDTLYNPFIASLFTY